ncbi:hypothetical protein [Methanobrevibacter sp.]|uniref:hypothetical protein n=1 Tax=Methanobrevibacter sp. TaxID=66852 RepID=UPI0038631027
MGSVSALDFGSFLGGDDGENQTVTIDGIDFNVPDGFIEDPNHATVNEQKEQSGVTYITNGKVFEKGDTVVALLVADYGDYKITDDIVKNVGGDAKTINNIDGYFKTDDNYKVFSYAKDDKLVVLSATDEDAIGEFLIG